jgi:hypothetical protein
MSGRTFLSLSLRTASVQRRLRVSRVSSASQAANTGLTPLENYYGASETGAAMHV